MNNRKVKSKNLLIVFIMLVCCLFTPFSTFTLFASADTSNYSNVLEDLQKDESFNVEDYPVNAEDYSLSIIQIAETLDKQLLVYVYNPSVDRVATTISLSTGINNNFFPELYNLILQSKENTLAKYVVEDLQVKEDVVRYYDIVSIFRSWDENIDKEAIGGNTISEVSYEVGKLYTACTLDGKVYYSFTDVETIDITDKYVGFVRYDDGYVGSPGMGLSWYKPGYDSHFVAFSTDRKIDRLYEAEVYYDTQLYTYSKQISAFVTISESETFYEIEEGNKAELTYTEKVEIKIPHGLFFQNSYSFDRIQSVEEFVNTENREFVFDMGLFSVVEQTKITDESLNSLNGKQWVLRFAETEYEDYRTGDLSATFINKKKTIVGNVSILRLKFETDGKVYNLGVVDNKQTGNGVPDNNSFDLLRWLKGYLVEFLLILLFVIIIVPLFIAFFPQIMVGLVKVGKWLVKGLWWILTLPYQIFKNR